MISSSPIEKVRGRTVKSWVAGPSPAVIRVLRSAITRGLGSAMAPGRVFAVALALFSVMAGWTSAPAQARVFVGIGIPFGGYYPAPYYYPPPVYYPPPPVYYAPPTVYAPPPNYSRAPDSYGASQMCYAASYSCPMDRPVAPGGSCYCLGNGGQRVWGRAN